MIVKNTTNADFNALSKLRDCFIKKYDIDPYDLIRSLGNKNLENMKKEEIVKAIIKNLRDVNGKKFRKDDVQAIVNFL